VLIRFPHGHYVPVSGNGGRLLFHGYGAVFGMEPQVVRHPVHHRVHPKRHIRQKAR
jgi:hypothetical protein